MPELVLLLFLHSLTLLGLSLPILRTSATKLPLSLGAPVGLTGLAAKLVMLPVASFPNPSMKASAEVRCHS